MHKLIAMRCRPAPSTAPFSPPQAWEINLASIFAGEVFGPILHVVRWRADRLDRVLDEIAATGYGLTLGSHSPASTRPCATSSRATAAAPATTAPAAMNGKASRPGPQRQP
jgi:delta 1-pyrroline-5-carboxylate dehydrogenase